MKKTASLVLVAVLYATAGASSATVDVTCKVKHGKCKAEPPAPPAPPSPPAPPQPPAPPPPPDGDNGSFRLPSLPALPHMPALPAIPAPPPPPKVPDVPAEAHAACAGKAAGTEITYTMRPGQWMRGVCERDGKQMAFMMRRYHED